MQSLPVADDEHTCRGWSLHLAALLVGPSWFDWLTKNEPRG